MSLSLSLYFQGLIATHDRKMSPAKNLYGYAERNTCWELEIASFAVSHFSPTRIDSNYKNYRSLLHVLLCRSHTCNLRSRDGEIAVFDCTNGKESAHTVSLDFICSLWLQARHFSLIILKGRFVNSRPAQLYFPFPPVLLCAR